MESGNYLIVQTIESFLGKSKSDYDALNRKQWQFNCPSLKCKHDFDKFNLEYQSDKHVFKCWKCEYHGYVLKLVAEYGSSHLEAIKSILPKSTSKDISIKKQIVDHHLITCDLPEGYLPLGQKRNTKLYKLAWEYLVNQRKVSPSLIDKYEIGYTEHGPRKFRIIIPSKNALGRFNYYEARSYMKDAKISYIKPSSEDVKKTDIIFNEYFINWDLPIYLVEGVFDMFRIPNSIPILGKEISPLLVSQLIKHNSKVIVCFDPDAMSKTIETYELLSSLGLDVMYIDLQVYDKDISKIYEDHGQSELINVLKSMKKMNLFSQIKSKLQ